MGAEGNLHAVSCGELAAQAGSGRRQAQDLQSGRVQALCDDLDIASEVGGLIAELPDWKVFTRPALQLLPDLIELQSESGSPLRQIVVQFPRDPGALLLLCLHQPPTERRQGFSGERMSGDVNRRADVPGKCAVHADDGSAAVEDPPIDSVVPKQSVLHPKRPTVV